jgi:tetratricopeptide (TPR) repeat protein
LAQKWLRHDSPEALTLRANLAGLETELGDPQRAMDLLDEVIKVRTQLLGPLAADTLTSRYAYWNAMWASGRYEDAAAGFQALLPDIGRGISDDCSLAASTRLSIARALIDGNHPQEALPFAQKAAEQFLAIHGAADGRTQNAVNTVERIKRAPNEHSAGSAG